LKSEPDERGHFGQYGGRFVSETLIAALDELEAEYPRICALPAFQRERASSMACCPPMPGARPP
jgi:tryptophan synthase beta chain